MAEPKIYSDNYVTEDCDFTLSHGGTVSKIYDRDLSSQYTTSGAASDATEMSIAVTFKINGEEISRTFGRVILRQTNGEDIGIDYWDGASWVQIAADAAVATTYKIFSFSEVSASRFRLRISDTQTTNQEKLIGELYVGRLRLDVGTDMDSYDQNFRQKTAEIALADGSLHRPIVYNTPDRSVKYEARVRFNFLSTTTLASLQSIYNGGVPFYWHPESESRPEELYFVHWVGQARSRYADKYKGGGHQIEMELKEV